MNNIVIYSSRYGNREKIAEAIATVLRSTGPTLLCSVDEAPEQLPEEIDLVVIGGPTESHGMPEALKRYFDRIGPGALHDKAATVFDTRLNWPHWLSGSAGANVTEKLDGLGAWLIAPAERFLERVVDSTLRGGSMEHVYRITTQALSK